MCHCAAARCTEWATFNCGRCLVRYCSEACQRAAWPAHRAQCKRAWTQARARLAAARADIEALVDVPPSLCPCATCKGMAQSCAGSGMLAGIAQQTHGAAVR